MSHEPEDRSIEACDPEGGRRSKEVLREMEMCYQKTIGTYCVRKYIYIYTFIDIIYVHAIIFAWFLIFT